MTSIRAILILVTGMYFTIPVFAQEAEDSLSIDMAEDTTTVEIRDFDGKTRQYRWQVAMWDQQKIGEWDEMAGNRLTLRRIPDATMEDLRKMKALQYEQKTSKPRRPEMITKLGLWALANFGVIRNIFYIVLGIILLLTVLLFIRKSSLDIFSRSRRMEETAAETATDAGPQHYDALAQAAAEAGDYRGAVRIRYLQALYILQEKELILPGKDKTNLDFLRELSATAFHRPFAALTRHYEYIWYGKVPVNGIQFTQLDEQFAEFKKSLRN